LKNINTILAVGTVAAVCGAAEAAVVVGWDFAGVTSFGTSPFAPTEFDANISYFGLTRGGGVGTTGTAASNAWGGTMGSTAQATLAAAVAAEQFVSFSVGINPDVELDCSGISAYNVRRSSSGPASGQWQYRVLGSEDWTNIGSSVAFAGTTSSGNSMAAIDLSGVGELQNLSGTNVYFRLVLFGNSGGGTFYFKDMGSGLDLSLNGSVSAVPAPGAATLIGLAGLVTTRRRK
jgi:MYXO-CTERM domain-containing protein